jgi:hypothetical protein
MTESPLTLVKTMKTLQPASLALAVAAILTCGTASQAAPIFSQMTVPPTGEFYSDSQHGAGVLTADDFVLGGSDTIRSVFWQGANSPAGAPGPDSFRINIYADPIDGSSLIQSFSVGAANRSATGGTVGAGDILYNYSANLGGAGFFVTAGTRYWISIVNDAMVDPINDWTWAGSFSGSGRGSFNNGLTWFSQASQTNFVLDNASLPAAVPEPATLTLVCLGLVAIARARKHVMPHK